MQVSFYQAQCGDAARICYIGNDGRPHSIFIDSGYERTFRNVLANEIKYIGKNNGFIDLWIISHIHADHIGGALAYIKAIKTGEFRDIVQSWFYNPPRRRSFQEEPSSIDPISSARSILQGDALAGYLFLTNKLQQNDILNDLTTVDLYGLKITVLSPDNTGLEDLRAKYTPEKNTPFERIENAEPSHATSPAKYDYNIRLTDFDLEDQIEDNSVENGSSISVLTEFQGKKILWLADAHCRIVISSLNKLGYSKTIPLVCDWVKVAHHGSKGNNISALYDIIQCGNYLFSADGINSGKLPNKECIARILRNTQRNGACTLYFTYDNSLLRSIFEIDGPEVFEEFNFSIKYFSQPCTIIDF